MFGKWQVRQTRMSAPRSSRHSTLRGDLLAEPLFLFAKLGGEFRAKIFGIENLANFDLGLLARSHRRGAALDPLDRLLLRAAFPEPEAGDQLFRFGERAVDHSPLAAREL